jgi:hypothetical protein
MPPAVPNSKSSAVPPSMPPAVHTSKSSSKSSAVLQASSTKVLALARDSDLQSLATLARSSITLLHSIKVPDGGWNTQLPVWAGQGRKRGLACWGSRNAKNKPQKTKLWQSNQVCRMVIQSALTFYADNIGLPPVVTGKKKKKGKQKKKKLKVKCGSGHTRGQEELVPCEGAQHIDIHSTFTLVLHARYCTELKPPVEDGTDASFAVLNVLLDPLNRKRLISSVCTGLG